MRRVFPHLDNHKDNHKGTTKFHEQLRFSCFDRKIEIATVRTHIVPHHHTSCRAHGGHWLRRSRARGAAVHRRRMVHPSIAGAGCILPSRARGASVDRGPGLHCGRGLQLSRAVLFSPCKSCTKGLRSVPAAGAGCVDRRRGVQPSIAGPGCSCRSRARAAPLRSRIAAVPSSAAPGHAATRACCSNMQPRVCADQRQHIGRPCDEDDEQLRSRF